MGEFSKKTIK